MRTGQGSDPVRPSPFGKLKWPKSWEYIEDPVVPLERNLYGHPLAGLLWERQFGKALMEPGWEKLPFGNVYSFTEKIFLSIYVDDTKMERKKQTLDPMWKKLMKNVDIDEPTSFLDHVYLGCTQRECNPNEKIIGQYNKMFESRISAGATEKLPGWDKPRAKTSAWSYDMEGHARKCVERHYELAPPKKTEQLYKVSSLCLDDHQIEKEELENKGELSEVCSHIVLKCLYRARIGRPDILWSVNQLARSVTTWTKTCNR